MARNPYSASERRGILAVGVVSLLIISLAMIFSLCRRDSKTDIIVKEYPELIDSSAFNATKNDPGKKKRIKSSKTKSAKKKTYRKRSPLDEPV